MHSYDFIIKGELTGFKSFNEKYIWIDKEEMVNVLSAHGFWDVESSRVILKNNLHNQTVYLEEYIMKSFGSDIKQINGNVLDFRKNNLLISPHEHSPYFIRPLSKKDIQSNHALFGENLSQTIFSIKRQHEQIGFISFLPVTEEVYVKFIQNEISKKELLELSCSYENESNYYHLVFGEFPEEEELFSYLTSFYKNILFSLKLRAIKILKLATSSDNSCFIWGNYSKHGTSQWNLSGNEKISFLEVTLSNFYQQG